MTFAAFHRLGQSVFHVSFSAFGPAPQGPSAAAPEAAALRSIKWRLLTAQELATPGFMTLRSVRDGGPVVDFVWDFASAAAARLLCHSAIDLVGRRLLDVFAGHAGRPAVFAQYRRVVECGAAEAIKLVHGVNGTSDSYRHGAVRLGDGVAVTLINLSAVRRAEMLQLEFSSQQAATTRRAR